MVQSIVTPDDVAAELGRPLDGDFEKAQVQRWINSCLLLITTRLNLEIDDLEVNALKIVVPQVVARKVNNPDGKTSERIDDYYYTRDVGKYGLALTDEEWEMVTPIDVRDDMGAFTITTHHAPSGPSRWSPWY